ncbi:MAG: hypothetical protein ACO3UU_03760 [Minisyncoccia bacterium]
MVNYKLDAMFELRRYLWEKLHSNNIFDKDDYWSDNLNENIVPIIPIQQTPEMSQFLSGKKHIVYDKIGVSYKDNWLICCEQILFTVYTTDISEIVEIRNFMTDEFRRMDESAKDINYWSGISDKFKFHSIFIADISPTSPSEELQGFLSTDIILEIQYSRITDNSGRFA